jgi:hypothetical protein
MIRCDFMKTRLLGLTNRERKICKRGLREKAIFRKIVKTLFLVTMIKKGKYIQ